MPTPRYLVETAPLIALALMAGSSSAVAQQNQGRWLWISSKSPPPAARTANNTVRGTIMVSTADGRQFSLEAKANDREGLTGNPLDRQCPELIVRYSDYLGFGNSALGHGHQVALNFANRSNGRFQFHRNGASAAPPLEGAVISISGVDSEGRSFPPDKGNYGHVGIVQTASFNVDGNSGTIALFDQNWPGSRWKTVRFELSNGAWYGSMENNPEGGPNQVISVVGWANPARAVRQSRALPAPSRTLSSPPSTAEPGQGRKNIPWGQQPYLASTVPAAPIPNTPGSPILRSAPVIETSVNFSWPRVNGATSYTVEVSDAGLNQEIFKQQSVQPNLAARLPAGRTVRWAVHACNLNGCSDRSRPLYFTTRSAPAQAPMAEPAARPASAPPHVPSPSGPGSTGQPGPEQAGTSVTLRWSAVNGAQDYDLGIRDIASNRLVVDRRVSGTDFTASLAAGGRYRWNVAACNAAGCSAFTAPLHFTLRAALAAAPAHSTSQPPPPPPATTASAAPPRTPRNPVPGRGSSPGPEIPGQTITLQWDAVKGATHYDLSLRNMTTRRDMSVERLTQRFHIARVAKGETYRWSVSACNRTACSEPTDRLYFTAR